MSFPLPLVRAALPAAALLALSSVQAQPNLQEVVVSASRAAQRLQDALPSTTLIDRRRIEQSQASDLPALLRRVAGMEIAQNGGMGTAASAFLRGAEARHTLVLVDGMPVNNLNFGTASFEHLPLADIERIEIVRGNVSSLYGSAAVGGVIQIFTQSPGPAPRATLSAQAGSRDFLQAGGTGSLRLASGTGLRATVEGLRDGGFNAIRQDQRPGTNPDRDGYDRRSASVALTQEIGRHQLALTLREARGTTEYDSEFGPATQRDASQFRLAGSTLSGRFQWGDVRLDASVAHVLDRLDATVTAFPFFVNTRSDSGQLGLEWQLRPGHRLTAGLEHGRHRLRSDTEYDRSSRTVDSARIGYALDGQSHQLQLNLRRDRYSDFGSATTWLAAYGWRFDEAWRLHASLSSGFTAPTFNDLFFPFGLGNPDLRPERVRSAEIGLQYAAAGHEFRAVLFRNRFADLIASDDFFRRVNVARARTRGLELTYQGRVRDIDVTASFTRQDPRDLDTGQRLRRRAATLGHLSLVRDSGRWQWGGNLRYRGARPDSGVPSSERVRLAGYAVLDLTAGYALSPQWRLFGRVENVFDRDYQTAYGYRQAGRGVFIGARWQPKS